MPHGSHGTSHAPWHGIRFVTCPVTDPVSWSVRTVTLDSTIHEFLPMWQQGEDQMAEVLSLYIYNMFMRRLHDIAYIYVHICTKWPRLSLYIYMIYSSVSLYDMICTYTYTKWPRLSLSICTKSISLLYNVYHIMNTLSIMYITYVSIIYNAYYIMYTSYIIYIPCISYNVYILYNVYTMHII